MDTTEIVVEPVTAPEPKMQNIVTVCSAGLCRSVSLADVLKLHFEPCDVLPVGVDRNFGAKDMLFEWADKIVVMYHKFEKRIPEKYAHKVLLCDVGPDTYGTPKNPELIGKVWRWARENKEKLGIVEHSKKL